MLGCHYVDSTVAVFLKSTPITSSSQLCNMNKVFKKSMKNALQKKIPHISDAFRLSQKYHPHICIARFSIAYLRKVNHDGESQSQWNCVSISLTSLL